MLKVRFTEILICLFCSSSTFALEKSLVVNTRCHFIWFNLVFDHVFVNSSQLRNLFSRTTTFKQSSINELNISHWFYLTSDMIQYILRKFYQSCGMRTVNWKSAAENLEPQKINYLKLVTSDFTVVHFNEFFV